MFQIAAGYAHAKRHGLQLQIQDTKGYWNTYMHRVAALRSSRPAEGPLWREPCFSYTPIPAVARNLQGYFQSVKYFADVSGDIRALFDLPAPLMAVAAHKHAALLQIARGKSLALHIRRGDYMTPRHLKKHGILGPTYYQRAIAAARATLGDDVHIVVFSDDLAWCREQPWLSSGLFVDEPNGPVALWLMSQFQHYIMSNSTFSWWGVFLGSPNNVQYNTSAMSVSPNNVQYNTSAMSVSPNNVQYNTSAMSVSPNKGHVWAPDRWFGIEGPQDWGDIYSTSWKRVSI